MSNNELFKKCIYFSRTAPYIDAGGGGSRRTYQVHQALKALGSLEFVTSYGTNGQILKKINSKFRRLFAKNFLTDGEYEFWSKDRSEAIFRLRSISREWIKRVSGLFAADLAVVEDPVYFKPLVIKLKESGIPVIATCQNIESLSYGQISFANKQSIFNKELDTLALCDLVITISREDSWLLNNFRINTFFFPYFPRPQDQQRLLKIRSSRQKNKSKIQKGNIILLGNAGNIATRRGMSKVIEYWEKNNLAWSTGKLLVAGYKTDIFLKDLRAYKAVEFLGPLDNQALDEKLQTVKGCLCYQDEGGGALTRICEMLLAGIPVLANTNAARTYYNMKGVIEFCDLDDLRRALEQVERFDGLIPIPPQPDSSYLVSEIRKVIMK